MSDSSEHLFWCLGFGSTFICLLLSIPLLVGIIRNVDNLILPFTKIAAVLSATLSVLCIAFYFSTFPICISIVCSDNFWGMFTYLSTMNSYMLSKMCLYSLFIARLYNDWFKKIYSYSIKILYSLLLMMLLALLTLAIVNALFIINFKRVKPKDVDNTNTAAIIVFVCLDFTLSVFTLILFVIPLCSRYGNRLKLAVLKYICLSLVSIISSTFCGILMIIRFSNQWYHAFLSLEIQYLDVLNSASSLDCLISLISIYFGFILKETYNCEKCCNCCLTLLRRRWNHHDNGLLVFDEIYGIQGAQNLINPSDNLNIHEILPIGGNENDTIQTTKINDQTITITTTVSSSDVLLQ
eukprot:362195_1